MSEKTVDELKDLLQKGHDMVSDLCHQRREWIMSIPARQDYDPDLVIGDALRAGDEAVNRVTAYKARLLERLEAMRSQVVNDPSYKNALFDAKKIVEELL